VSNFSTATFLHDLVFVSDSIFLGLRFLIPLIFLLTLFKQRLQQHLLKTTIATANTLLLIGGIFFMVVLSQNTFRMLYHGDENDRTFLIHMITGPNWYQFFFPVLNFGILPVLLLIRKFRRTIHLCLAWFACWCISYFTSYVLLHQGGNIPATHSTGKGFLLNANLEKGILFTVLFLALYLINSKRELLRMKKPMNAD